MFRTFLYSAVLLVFASAVFMMTAKVIIDHWFSQKLKFISIIAETAGKALTDAEKEKQAKKLASDDMFTKAIASIKANYKGEQGDKK